MADLKEDASNDEKGVKKENDDEVFDINKATENFDIVESSENPYYEGMYEVNIENETSTNQNEGADNYQITKNPGHADVEETHLDESNINSEFQSSIIPNKTEQSHCSELEGVYETTENTIMVKKEANVDYNQLSNSDKVVNGTKT